MKELPIYKLSISDVEGDETKVDFVALVDEPAIQKNWLAFSNKQQFAANKDRRIVTGALMIADLPIYRRDERFGEYYVVFDKPAIQKIVERFFKKQYTSNVNLMHQPEAKVDGVYMIESIIVDSSRGVTAPKGFEDLPDGSWIGSYKVDNEKVWNEFIKNGTFKGFSVEGVFNYEYESIEKEKDILSDIHDILK